MRVKSDQIPEPTRGHLKLVFDNAGGSAVRRGAVHTHPYAVAHIELARSILSAFIPFQSITEAREGNALLLALFDAA